MNKKMKKNKAMRAAGGLFVATMLTTSVVSGTYAKYITEDSANDNARVAVFGVKVEASGELFGSTYYNVEQEGKSNTPGEKSNGGARTAEENTISVKSQSKYTSTQTPLNGDPNNVVAPGTQSSKEGLRLSLTGTPEVDVKVVFDFGDMSDIWLAKNDNNTYYPNMTNGKIYDGDFVYDEVGDDKNNSDVFKVEETYYPVEFNFAGGDAALDNIQTLDGFEKWVAGKLNDYAKGIGSTVNKEGDHRYTLIVPAGNDLSGIGLTGVNITWKWEFGKEAGVSGNDREDTLLGNLAHDTFGDSGNPVQNGLVKEATDAIQAAIDKIPPEDGNYSEWVNKTNKLANLDNQSGQPVTDSTTDAYSLITSFNLSISVTQID